MATYQNFPQYVRVMCNVDARTIQYYEKWYDDGDLEVGHGCVPGVCQVTGKYGKNHQAVIATKNGMQHILDIDWEITSRWESLFKVVEEGKARCRETDMTYKTRRKSFNGAKHHCVAGLVKKLIASGHIRYD